MKGSRGKKEKKPLQFDTKEETKPPHIKRRKLKSAFPTPIRRKLKKKTECAYCLGWLSNEEIDQVCTSAFCTAEKSSLHMMLKYNMRTKLHAAHSGFTPKADEKYKNKKTKSCSLVHIRDDGGTWKSKTAFWKRIKPKQIGHC